MEKAALEALLQQVKDLTAEVRLFIMNEFNHFDRNQVEYKGLNDMVSYVDREAEKKIVNRLKDLLPDAGFIAEEGTGKANSEGYNWIIDPVDGTTNFVHGVPIFAISIALAHQKDMVVGVVHELNHDECFTAIKGGGAHLNSQPIKVAPTTDLKRGLIATGFPYSTFGKLDRYMEILTEMMEKSHGLRRIGSAAVDLVYVACGRFEGFFEYNLNPWDVAAGALIVEEAGGKVTDFRGGNDPIFGRQILAACAVHPDMLSLIQPRFFDE